MQVSRNRVDCFVVKDLVTRFIELGPGKPLLEAGWVSSTSRRCHPDCILSVRKKTVLNMKIGEKRVLFRHRLIISAVTRFDMEISWTLLPTRLRCRGLR